MILLSVFMFLIFTDNKPIDAAEDMIMLGTIKSIIQQRAGGTALTEYYRSRLAATQNVIEQEAILYMSSLLSPLRMGIPQDNKESK